MKLAVTMMLLGMISGQAMAEQISTLTCTGKKVVLSERSPYLGENSPKTQHLFVLTGLSKDESANAAYFLDVSYDLGRAGTLYVDGKNEVGGKFSLVLSAPRDESDGTIMREVSNGTLKYNHGPLKGQEKVTCVRE